MEYRILGPLEVLEDGRPLALGNLKERMVLAVLLLHANEFVSRERLIDELWGVAPPATARKAVNVYLSKLRRTLSSGGRDPIATADGGYRLVVDGDLLDAERARSLLASARERVAGGDAATASRLLEEALGLWRGPTLAGLPLESFGRDEVAELDELRLAALMERIDCDLAQGRHEHVLGELQVLVREHPLRERLRAQLMLALYRSDRQAEALDAYYAARRDLVEELGIEPSESLQRLQQAILRHDPALEAPTGTAAVNGAPAAPAMAAVVAPKAHPSRSPPRRRSFRRRYLVAALLAAVAAAGALVVFLSSRGGGVKPPATPVSYVGPNRIARIDAATGAQLADLSGNGGASDPGPMAPVGQMLWIAGRGNARIERFDLRHEHGIPDLEPAPAIEDMVVDSRRHVWVSDRTPAVTWIGDVHDGKGPYEIPVVTSQRVKVPLPGAGSEAIGGRYLWVIANLPGRTGDSVALIDLHRRRLAKTIPLGRQTTALTYGYGSAWVGAYGPQDSTASLLKVKPGSAPISSLELESQDGAGPLALAVGAGDVWALTSRGNLLGIDPRTLRIVHRIPMARQLPELLTVARGSVWTANHRGYSVSMIDPRADKVVRTIPLGSYRAVPCGIEGTRETVFVAFGETTCR